MIKFKEITPQTAARDALVQEMMEVGFSYEDATRLTDAAHAIVIDIFHSLDDKVIAAETEESHRTVIQSIVLQQLASISERGLEVNRANSFLKMGLI